MHLLRPSARHFYLFLGFPGGAMFSSPPATTPVIGIGLFLLDSTKKIGRACSWICFDFFFFRFLFTLSGRLMDIWEEWERESRKEIELRPKSVEARRAITEPPIPPACRSNGQLGLCCKHWQGSIEKLLCDRLLLGLCR